MLYESIWFAFAIVLSLPCFYNIRPALSVPPVLAQRGPDCRIFTPLMKHSFTRLAVFTLLALTAAPSARGQWVPTTATLVTLHENPLSELTPESSHKATKKGMPNVFRIKYLLSIPMEI